MPSFSREPTVSQTVEWYTPAAVFRALGPDMFDLDVASPGAHAVPWVPALRHLTPAEDGLTAPWTTPAGGLAHVWLNPPYGRGLGEWVQRWCDHGAAGGSGVLLVFNRSENRWYRRLEDAHRATPGGILACLVHGRVAFRTAAGEAPGLSGAGSVLFGVGSRGHSALRCAARAGLGSLWAPV